MPTSLAGGNSVGGTGPRWRGLPALRSLGRVGSRGTFRETQALGARQKMERKQQEDKTECWMRKERQREL